MKQMQKAIKNILNVNRFNTCRTVSLLLLILLISGTSAAKEFQSYDFQNNFLRVTTDEGTLVIQPLTPSSVEVSYEKLEQNSFPSFAIDENLVFSNFNLNVSEERLYFSGESLEVVISKKPFSVQFKENGRLLLQHHQGFFQEKERLGVSFKITDSEKFIGGGQRVLGMDRRGHKLPLYNKTHWGYTTESNQMYFGLPAVMSSKGYALIFDNSARGEMDIGATEQQVLSFEAMSGRNAYVFVAGSNNGSADYPTLINRLTEVTGKQPLPPKWAFGNFASRFGYRSEQQVHDVVKRFQSADIPLDAVILDLYWFGKEMKGHMGNLDWDRENWPDAEKMIADFKEQGIKTVNITEPFILKTSKNWQSAVDAGALAKDGSGKNVKVFDMFFGESGLVDVFDENAQAWFWDKYRHILKGGVEGVWGDLGEPEVHPQGMQHAIGSAEEVHNVYGHQWARLVSDNFYRDFPDKRLFMLMRSGFMGSQRYGMLPWTGDVSRSWGGLKPQVELTLQMGLMGLAYTHSDLGGFGGDSDTFDKEMYIRWMQYGVFQPVYRPHAFESVAPEPVFHDKETQDILREFIKLRYRLLPYNYTLAYENTTTGMPLMRPLMFAETASKDLFHVKDSYLWGDNFLVHPVTDPGVSQISTLLPEGFWFDYWRGNLFEGGKAGEVPVTLNDIPVFVKAGSFIPMGPDISNTVQHDGHNITIEYYHHDSVKQGTGLMFEDDGLSPDSIASEQFLLTRFSSEFNGQLLTLKLNPEGEGYEGLPGEREIQILLKNLSQADLNSIKVLQKKYSGSLINTAVLSHKINQFGDSTVTGANSKVTSEFAISFLWNNKPVTIEIPIRTESRE